MIDQKLTDFIQKKYGLKGPQLQEGLILQKEEEIPLGQALKQLGYLTEEGESESLAVEWGLPFLASISENEIEKEWITRVPIGFAKKNEVIPIKKEGERVKVATARPLNLNALDDLRILFGREIAVSIAPSHLILALINQVYERSQDSADKVMEGIEGHLIEVDAGELPVSVDLLEATDEAPIIRLVNSLVFQAVKQRASDIHFEPFEREFVVRYRIDGILYNILSPPKRLQSSMTSRVKIMSGLDIAEKRLPQDGRISIRIAGKEIDIRVSTIPTAHGERLVLRLLDKQHLLLSLEDLGFSKEMFVAVSKLIHLSHGIILVTGPTGSGKTTTLYSILNKINSSDKNIITIEDPIEYQLKGVGQMQVNPKIDLTFANGLRSILRQDPDVILVGEIRDSATAEIAIHASLTGHLVFSTLHTNDSAGAIARLIDMGIEPFLVSSSLVAIIAQRLVRKLCKACKKNYSPLAEELEKLGLSEAKTGPPSFYRATGCPECLNTGYKGRIGIYELLLIDDAVRAEILSKVDSTTIKTHAIQKGLITLREDGARQVVAGVTTTDEVLRVTQIDM
ncbi:MAG: type II secretion system ATPase GspE [Nitrospirae bacterium]|nr:type II secretion system ATPase GspE [Nitrospirota bacterium]MBI3351384.1 type II secretion system ATPase GspE [Nitrospirota bacterium]